MKQVNFSHEGGFPLEQETLERLQTAYRSELYEAFKSHLSIEPNTNYIIAPASENSQGWAIIHQNEEDATGKIKLQGILYPISNSSATNFLRTTRTRTNLVYGTGASQTAYFDYEAKYISEPDYNNKTVENIDDGKVRIYDFYTGFSKVKDLKTIEGILDSIEAKVTTIKADINTINQTYLPLNGSKAMQGDLDLGNYRLSRLDTKENYDASLRAVDFNFGSVNRRGLKHPGNYLGRALADNSNQDRTDLTLNYGSDWENTTIGGKVHFDNLNTSTEDFTSSDSSSNSLLLMDNVNQVHKSNNLLNSLLNRISKLEKQPASTVPIGMIAIWGKPAPFPDGWEEYVPLRGRMPVGFDEYQTEFNNLQKFGGNKEKKLDITEMPNHGHDWLYSYEGDDDNTGRSYDEFTFKPGKITQTDPKNPIGKTGGSQPFSLLNPYQVVHFIKYTGKPNNTVPASPTNLVFSNIGAQTLTLNWAASTDTDVTNYVIYKNDELFATVENVLSYPVTGLSANTLYSFYVIAKNSTGNLSSPSQTESITTDKLKLKTPTIMYCSADTPTTVLMEWISSPAIAGIVSYEVYRKKNSEEYLKLDETINYYFIDTVSPGSTYYYQVRATDLAGNISDFSEIRMVTINGSSCFDIESPVTMASGQSKKLKNIVIGDKLQGFSFPNEIDESDGDYMLWEGKLNEASKTEVVVVNKRTSTQPAYYEIKTTDTLLKVTGEHPLLVTEDDQSVKWVYTKNLQQGMSLIDKAGKTKTIEAIAFKEEPLEVASLDVETVDNYIISGIVAHNKEMEPALN